jgi:putative hydrolase of the HAD superfamily
MQSAKTYRHLFFDLDKTLWDFDANSAETLRTLFVRHGIAARGRVAFDDFHDAYNNINRELWDKYRRQEVDKATLSFNRFDLTLKAFGLEDPDLSHKLAQEYIDGVSEQTRLFPYVTETMDYLYGRYTMHVITNGFMEVQYRKMETSGLGKYFSHIITSEEAGAHKPSLRIFQYALSKTGAAPSESIMIGDDPAVDMIGARSAGIDQIFVNYEGIDSGELFTYEVRSLRDIRAIL